MKSYILPLLVFIILGISLFCAGCTTNLQQENTAVSKDSGLYSRGDLLSGNMSLAGYDTPDANVSRYKVVILEYQPKTQMYVYTFIEPREDGTVRYVLNDSWEARLARERTVLEGYGLVKTGNLPANILWNVS